MQKFFWFFFFFSHFGARILVVSIGVPYFYIEHLLIFMCTILYWGEYRTIGFVNLSIFQVASFLLYLSDVEEGGETMFPFEVSSLGIVWARFFLLHVRSVYYRQLFCHAEWRKYGQWLWLPEVHWFEGEAASRGWSSILFIIHKWDNWSGMWLLLLLIDFFLDRDVFFSFSTYLLRYWKRMNKS